MSNSTDKMDVVVTKKMPWGEKKEWVKVSFKKFDTWWIPSFEDLYRIIRAIAHCEDRKYPNGKGKDMVADFLRDSVYFDDFDELMKKYQIPERDGAIVINDNGAKVETDGN